jgi:hypothetical protein
MAVNNAANPPAEPLRGAPAPDKSDDLQAIIRAVIVIVCLIVLVIVVIAALNWHPGGVITDANNNPLKDAKGEYMSKPVPASDIVAIVGAVTTFLGTALGTYFGVNLGARAGTQAAAAAATAQDTARKATDAAMTATDAAKSLTEVAKSATDTAQSAKVRQDALLQSFVDTYSTVHPHVAAADQTAAQVLDAKIDALKQTVL